MTSSTRSLRSARALLLGGLLALSPGCYVLHATGGQLSILCGREPIDEVLERPGLDAETVRAVEAVLRERLKAGAGMLFVSHDEDQAGRLARRCLRVAAGVVTEGVL